MGMRQFMFYLMAMCPLLLEGQVMRCDTASRYSHAAGDEAYERFLSMVRFQEDFTRIHPRTIRYFPVVVHVVAREGFQPVSRAQVLHQLDVLNDDFAGTGENVGKLISHFQPLVSNTELRFCLADTDPLGQPTTGITFTTTTIPNIALQTADEGRIAIHYDLFGGKTGWDPDRYINIWVGEYGDILGSASFPGMASFEEEIGIIMDIRHFGSIGDAGQSGRFGRGHTLTHEMGHFFGLKHIWGDGIDADCSDTDDIDDTPNAAGPYYDCPSGNQVSCFENNMFQNFMDFTDDWCLAAFTHGQTARMHAVIDIYYPDLARDGSCSVSADRFETWYDQLSWSHDAGSNRYVIYNPENWEGLKHIKVCSVDGKIIFEDTWEGQLTYLIDLNHVASGIYIVRIDDGDRFEVRKISVY